MIVPDPFGLEGSVGSRKGAASQYGSLGCNFAGRKKSTFLRKKFLKIWVPPWHGGQMSYSLNSLKEVYRGLYRGLL